MKRNLLGIFGLSVFLLSIFFGIRFHYGGLQASSLDKEKKGYGAIADGPLPCTWDVKPPEKVMTENTSQGVIVQVNNPMEEACESIISLRAPGFDLSPNKEEQKINVPASGSGSLSWIMSSRKTGTFEVAVSDIINTKIFGVSVTNAFGLTATQAQIFSIAGTLFGPMFTVPWWWEKFFQRKKKKEAEKNKT